MTVAGRQRGYVLAITLWLLAMIAVGASYLADHVERATERARQLRTQSEALLAMAEARADVLFRLGTVSLSIYGLGSLPEEAVILDDRRYKGQSDTIVSIQDDRGLINLNNVSDATLTRLFGVLGIEPTKQAMMIDTLRDYVDDDDLRRLNGAEKIEYAAAGMPPPRNAPLMTPYELRNVMGWRDVEALWQDDLLPRLTVVSDSVALNPNTAPWQVLASLPGADRDKVRMMMVRRKLKPFVSETDVALFLGIPVDALLFQIMPLPADGVRVTQTASGLPWSQVWHVTLTPMDSDAPWRIDYHFKSGSTMAPTATDTNVENIPALPPYPKDPLSFPSPVL